MKFETIEAEPLMSSSPRIIDISNLEEFWTFIQNHGQFSPMAVQEGCLEQYKGFFSKIEDCIILHKKIEQEFNFVNCSKDSISGEQKFDAYIFINNENIPMQDFSNEVKALKEKFNIRELYGSDQSAVFKTKQNSDLVFVLKRVN
ncbi:MAG: hypothetical protein MSH22_06340 [Spirochaetia bacterium]|nr:hypothetical protein [Spirochaetia bacterium]